VESAGPDTSLRKGKAQRKGGDCRARKGGVKNKKSILLPRGKRKRRKREKGVQRKKKKPGNERACCGKALIVGKNCRRKRGVRKGGFLFQGEGKLVPTEKNKAKLGTIASLQANSNKGHKERGGFLSGQFARGKEQDRLV